MHGHARSWKRRLYFLIPLTLGVALVVGAMVGRRLPLIGGDQERGPRDPDQVDIKHFERFVRRQEGKDPEAVIRGVQATVRGDRQYRIQRPSVDSLVGAVAGPDGAQPVSVQDAHVTATQAEFDERRGVLFLTGSVRAEGKDFEATTDHLNYLVNSRTVSTDAPVVLKRYRVEGENARELMLQVTGTGLEGDLTLRSVKVLHNPLATLFNVSEEFLQSSAAGDQTKPTEKDGAAAAPPVPGPLRLEGSGAAHELVVVADGPMTYNHLARRVTFENNVVATYGPTRLTCRRLEVATARDEASKKLQVTGITAQDDVVFSNGDQVGRGAKLVWENLTQTGVLTGEPARLSRPDMQIAAGRITFFRVDMRFRVEGPGDLSYEPAAAGGAQPARQVPDSSRKPQAPVPIGEGGPVRVSWQKEMRYDAASRAAVFSGSVHTEQGKDKDTLDCDDLELRLSESSGQKQSIDSVIAGGHVRGRQALAGQQRDVACDRAVWSARNRTVNIYAAEGGQVTVSSQGQKLTAAQAAFDQSANILSCPGAGELVMPSQKGPEGLASAEPIQVRWSDSMRFHGGEQQNFAEFEGNVAAFRPGEKITCRSLRVDFDSGMNPLRITASGGAVLEARRDRQPGEAPAAPVQPAPAPAGDKGLAEAFALPEFSGQVTQWRISSESLIGDVGAQTLAAPGSGTLEVLRAAGEGDVLRWSESMTVDQGGHYAQFNGKISGVFSGSSIECDRLLRLDFDAARQLRHIDAKGNVRFRAAGDMPWDLQGEEAEAIFAPASTLSQVVARGSVVVKDGERSVASQLLQLYFEKAEGAAQPDLSRAVAKGNVVLTYGQSDPLKATCEEMKWSRATDEYVLNGNPAELARSGRSVQGPVIYIDRKTGTMRLPEGGRTTVQEEQ